MASDSSQEFTTISELVKVIEHTVSGFRIVAEKMRSMQRTAKTIVQDPDCLAQIEESCVTVELRFQESQEVLREVNYPLETRQLCGEEPIPCRTMEIAKCMAEVPRQQILRIKQMEDWMDEIVQVEIEQIEGQSELVSILAGQFLFILVQY